MRGDATLLKEGSCLGEFSIQQKPTPLSCLTKDDSFLHINGSRIRTTSKVEREFSSWEWRMMWLEACWKNSTDSSPMMKTKIGQSSRKLTPSYITRESSVDVVLATMQHPCSLWGLSPYLALSPKTGPIGNWSKKMKFKLETRTSSQFVRPVNSITEAKAQLPIPTGRWCSMT